MGGGKTWISVRCVVLEHMCRTRVCVFVFCVTSPCACQTLVLPRHSGSRLTHIGTRALRHSMWRAWRAWRAVWVPSRALTTLRKNYREKGKHHQCTAVSASGEGSIRDSPVQRTVTTFTPPLAGRSLREVFGLPIRMIPTWESSSTNCRSTWSSKSVSNGYHCTSTMCHDFIEVARQ